MLVSALRKEPSSAQQHSSRRKASATTAKPSLFAELVALHKSTEIRPKTKLPQQELDELLADLEEAEQHFVSSATRESFEHYRTVIRRLTQFLLQKGYMLQQLTSTNQKKKIYEVVKVVDQKMAELLQHVMRRHNDVVIILHIMGEIRGLVVDIFS